MVNEFVGGLAVANLVSGDLIKTKREGGYSIGKNSWITRRELSLAPSFGW